jgi:hypothetical protein
MLLAIVVHKFLLNYPCFSRVVTPHLSRVSSDCGDSTCYYFAITILYCYSKNNTVVVTFYRELPLYLFDRECHDLTQLIFVEIKVLPSSAFKNEEFLVASALLEKTLSSYYPSSLVVSCR